MWSGKPCHDQNVGPHVWSMDGHIRVPVHFCFTLVEKNREKNRLIPNLSNKNRGKFWILFIFKYLQFFFRVKKTSLHMNDPHYTPGNLTLNLKMVNWKMVFLFHGCILRFHVNLPGCSHTLQTNQDMTMTAPTGWKSLLRWPTWSSGCRSQVFCRSLYGGGMKWCFPLGSGCWVWNYTSTKEQINVWEYTSCFENQRLFLNPETWNLVHIRIVFWRWIPVSTELESCICDWSKGPNMSQIYPNIERLDFEIGKRSHPEKVWGNQHIMRNSASYLVWILNAIGKDVNMM